MSAPTLTSAAASRPPSAPELVTEARGTAATAPRAAALLRSRSLQVGGITPFSATDYPGKLAAVVVVQGCPWRCGYCHNPHLQTRSASSPLDWPQVLALLKRRVGLIDAVVFSGGEPTIDPALEDAMREVRALGFAIGLHTAGAYPRRLAEILPLLDWVGIDVKTSPRRYDALTQISGSGQALDASLQAVLESGVPHEVRTTLHPDLHTSADILALARSLSAMGVHHYALQEFRAVGCVDEGFKRPAAAAYLGAALVSQVRALFPNFTLREV